MKLTYCSKAGTSVGDSWTSCKDKAHKENEIKIKMKSIAKSIAVKQQIDCLNVKK